MGWDARWGCGEGHITQWWRPQISWNIQVGHYLKGMRNQILPANVILWRWVVFPKHSHLVQFQTFSSTWSQRSLQVAIALHLHQTCQYASGVSDNPAHLKSAWDAYIKAPRSLPVLWCLHLLIEQPALTILVCCFFHFYSLAFILGFKKRSCEVPPDYQIIHCIKEMTIPTLSDSYCFFLILYSPYVHYIKLKLPR